MLRKSVVLIVILAVLLSLVGCGFRKNIERKVSDKITEGILEKVVGDDVDVNFDDGEMSFKGGDGSEFTIGSTEWPEGKAIDLIPEFKKGEIASVLNSDKTSVIYIDGVEKADYEEYVEQVKGLGFTDDAVDLTVSDAIAYTAVSSKDKAQVSLSYGVEDKSMMISVVIQE